MRSLKCYQVPPHRPGTLCHIKDHLERLSNTDFLQNTLFVGVRIYDVSVGHSRGMSYMNILPRRFLQDHVLMANSSDITDMTLNMSLFKNV